MSSTPRSLLIYFFVFLSLPGRAGKTSTSTAPPRHGVHADCSERQIQIEDLDQLAKSSKDVLSFLKSIPADSLQSFTFVTNSLSLHMGKDDGTGRGKVSSMWPRVLRSSIDGKTTISFVCDPKNPASGKVEIIHFDDKENKFKTTEYDFGHESEPPVSPSDRVHKNPKSCVRCHAGSSFGGEVSLKPNWHGYPAWSDCKANRGIQTYGGNDDNMGPGAYREIYDFLSEPFKGCDDKTDKAAIEKSKQDYQEFRVAQKDNECFKTLPWPDDSDPEYKKYYPYAKKSLETQVDDARFDYSIRTNLRFTDTYSHLMGRRIAQILKQSPDYEKVKYFIALQGAGCLTDADKKKLSQLLQAPEMEWTSENMRSSLTTGSLPYQYGKKIGLQAKDWNMQFGNDGSPNYPAAIPNTYSHMDLSIHHIVAGEILKDIGQSNKSLQKLASDSITRAVSAPHQFGPRFSCIDDLGGGIKTDAKNDLCPALHKENAKHLAKLAHSGSVCEICKAQQAAADASPSATKQQTQEILNIAKVEKDTELDASISRGKELVKADSKGKCVTCHSSGAGILPKDFQFIINEADSENLQAESLAILHSRAKEGLADKIQNRLITTKTMPPMQTGLSDQDRSDIQAYLKSMMK
jgi:mono/diheme cytochrome c family protein